MKPYRKEFEDAYLHELIKREFPWEFIEKSFLNRFKVANTTKWQSEHTAKKMFKEVLKRNSLTEKGFRL